MKRQSPLPKIASDTDALQFPVRFAHKFGKLSAGGKRRNTTQAYSRCAAVSGEISGSNYAESFVRGRSLVLALQRA